MMKLCTQSILILICFSIWSSCTRYGTAEYEEHESTTLDEKAEPYDLFAFQRSYPDYDFDWQGWRRQIDKIQQKDQEAAAKFTGNCSENITPWTLQGPGNVGGRCNTIAIKPDNETTILAGFSGGGIFKTIDGGTNWYPVFDENAELSIGHIAFDPSNPNVVYAGTGDPNMPSIVFNGNGLFKSTDAGEHWQYVGLSNAGIISKVVVHPTNPQIILVATMGNPYVRNMERGVYRTTDGGQTWSHVLFVSDQAGASDLEMSPANPQLVYASFWDRIRSNSESFVYGPHASVYKSANGGATWTKLEGGLPTGVHGRTGLAISTTDANKVYAVYIDSLGKPEALFKTTDGGTAWTPMNIVALKDACADFGWYFGKLSINPQNDEDLYFHAILLYRKQAGSNAWLVASGGHADSHDLAFAPSGKRYWANDGGVYRNEVNSATWVKNKNLPSTQFYHTTYNPTNPNVYYGGAQDNGIQKGNAANYNAWTMVFPADGFNCAFHPTNPNLFWIEIQNGAIHKTVDGGQTWQQQPTCLGTTDRCNWDTPYFLSKHNPEKLYAGTYRAYASSDGTGWGAISNDLTDGPGTDGRFHTISCIDESPVTANKLYVGTTDGNVWIQSSAGQWTNITTGLPDRYVTSVHGSPTLSNRLYATHSGFRNNENIPHIHRSDNNGASWVDISGDMPQLPVNDLFILPGHSDSLLFAGTDIGVYYTLNGGVNWKRLGSGMPYVPVFELEHNLARKELVAASYARGIYTFPLDSIYAQQTTSTINVSGVFKTEDNLGVADVSVSGVFSGSNGSFLLPGVGACQTITLTPQRNDNHINGVSTFDLVLISKHLLALEPITSPYKLIAADANKSGSITTFDIVQLRKLILGVDTVLAGNTSWRFVPANFVFPAPDNPFQSGFPESLTVDLQNSSGSNLNFKAIKVGDLNGNAIPNLQENMEERTTGDWEISTGEQHFMAGERFEVPIYATSENVDGVQFSLHFDPDILQFESLTPQMEGLSKDNFGLNRTKNGWISVSFENLHGRITSEAPVFILRFKARNKGLLSEHFQTADFPTKALAFSKTGETLKPVLRFKTLTSAQASVILVYPNPFGLTGTTIQLPSAWGNATINLYDGNGKLIFERQNVDTNCKIDAAVFPQSGAYYCRVVHDGKTEYCKLLYIK